jgi:hypothetical protein
MFAELALFAFRFGGHFYVVEPILITYIIHSFHQKFFIASMIAFAALIVAYVNYVILVKVEPYFFFVDYSSI